MPELIAAYVALWKEGGIADLEAFVGLKGPLCPSTLAELARTDQEQRALRRLELSVESYLRAFPALAKESELVLDLVYHEYLIRTASDSPPALQEYRDRFPDLGEQLEMQIQFGEACGSTVTVRPDVETFGITRGGSLPFQTLPTQFGRYRIDGLLGRGSMGTVWRAFDSWLERAVALKIPTMNSQGMEHKRFLREARAAARLDHPGLCPVIDHGAVDGVSFLTMPLIQGEPLSARIADLRQGPIRDTVLLFRSLTKALGYAHREGVLHRDLKSANIMILPDGEPIVMDFGLARLETSDTAHSTAAGTLVGTPAYMAPELFQDGQPSAASDIYSLGVVMYETLSGAPPFTGPLHSLIARVLIEETPPLRSAGSELDDRLDTICRRALDKSPANRFASMESFGDALDDWLNMNDGSKLNRATPGPGGSKVVPVLLAVSALVLIAAVAVIALIDLPPNATTQKSAPNTISNNELPHPSFRAGSRWSGRFNFLPPVEDYSADASLLIEARDGERVTAVYSTEGDRYRWRVEGTLSGSRLHLNFVELLGQAAPDELVGSAELEGDITDDVLNLNYLERNTGHRAVMNLHRE